ncbi:MAG: GDSL-type esterase/lipase family protein [Crocinitomicaceae bacterium]|jgi:lysophospholipase L1-like esterase|nr:GDSL-type esterase/lipase family protein [Crocinitomicaceae bacterium]
MNKIFFYIIFYFPILALGQVEPDSNRINLFETVCIDSNAVNQFPFINFDENIFTFPSNENESWDELYNSMDSMIRFKDRKLNFYHIGGSHIQADIYTHDFRSFLQRNWPGLGGHRGLVFPFNLARTNNPGNYRFTSSNSWSGYRSVIQRPEFVHYGITGAAISCSDSLIDLNFIYKKTRVSPPIEAIRIYHNSGVIPFEFNFGSNELLIESVRRCSEMGYTEIQFTDAIDTLDIQFIRNTKEKYRLDLYGFELMNAQPGISYNSIGINGAGLYTYLDNEFFLRDLKQTPPDFFAFSVGTNDGFVPYDSFKPEDYKKNLEAMVKIVLEANPKCAILLTVPNDCYYKRRYPNKNTDRQRAVIIDLAAKYNTGVWDFYGFMGGLGSSDTWRNAGLMRNDLVHFTKEGYHLKGELYIDAFLKYLNQKECEQENINF